MTIEKVSIAPTFIGLDGPGRFVADRPLRASAGPTSRSTPRRMLSALLSLITVGSDVMREAHQLRCQAARRYPHLNFDA